MGWKQFRIRDAAKTDSGGTGIPGSSDTNDDDTSGNGGGGVGTTITTTHYNNNPIGQNPVVTQDQQEQQKRKRIPSLPFFQNQRKQAEQHHHERIVLDAATPPDPETIYDFYMQNIFPAIIASLPILMGRIWQDSWQWIQHAAHSLYLFILPTWMKENYYIGSMQQQLVQQQENVQQLWEQAIESSKNLTFSEFLLNNFDANDDGHISPSELMNLTESFLTKMQMPALLNLRSGSGENSGNMMNSLSFLSFVSREWPLLDWKIGKLLWHTFGGLFLVIAVLSIIPGRLHSWSGRILRWPVLALTYLLISVELVAYIMIRLGIRIVETFFQNPKHRQLRRKMASAETYEEWYSYAAALDISQKRDKWQKTVDDAEASQYNWPLIRQLMVDMKEARDGNDPIQAMAVMQQCSRKNAGGVMSEDLFTKTYTGEPKFVVIEFITEVTKTLHWITDQTLRKEQIKRDLLAHQEEEERQSTANEVKRYNKKLERKTRYEHDKIWRSLVALATLNFNVNNDHYEKEKAGEKERGGEAGPSETAGPPEAVTFDFANLNELLIEERSSRSNSIDIPGIPREQLLVFMKRARAAYGRTALCLSGGAMMGLYHIGHLQGLMETDSLPNIVSGCSAGSVIGAVLCTRTNEELARDLLPDAIGPKMKCFQRSWSDRIVSVWQTGNLFSGDEWLDMIRWFACGDLTFEEAFRKTGRVLCISLSPTSKKTPPILLNYVSAPHVTIGSAVVASAAVPGFVSPQHLRVKDFNGNVSVAGPETYFDGSIRHDIPTAGLSEMLNCQFFVACQCNPHIVPFFFNPKGGVGKPNRWLSGEEDRAWRGGFLLSAMEMYLKESMKSKFTFLRDLDAAVGFTGTMMTQSFEGSTTIVPQVQLRDFFTLFTDPTVDQLYRYLQVGKVAAYQHAAMIRLHYRIADALDHCIEQLEDSGAQTPSEDMNDIENSQLSPVETDVEQINAAMNKKGLPGLQKVKASRRASFEVARNISKAVLNVDSVRYHLHQDTNHNATSRQRNGGGEGGERNVDFNHIPKIVTAALNERLLEDCGSSSTQSLSNGSK